VPRVGRVRGLVAKFRRLPAHYISSLVQVYRQRLDNVKAPLPVMPAKPTSPPSAMKSDFGIRSISGGRHIKAPL
jgi:hypothetical protein